MLNFGVSYLFAVYNIFEHSIIMMHQHDESVEKSEDIANPLRKTFDEVRKSEYKDTYISQTDPWAPQNIAIFASYLAVGFSIYFILTPLNFYMIDDLDATPSQQAIIIGLTNLPWALKVI